MAKRQHPFAADSAPGVREDKNDQQGHEVPDQSGVNSQSHPLPIDGRVASAPIPTGVSGGDGPPSDLSGKAPHGQDDPTEGPWSETSETIAINTGTGQLGKGGASGSP